jgi:hypothetical protein
MIEPGTTERTITAEGISGAADEPTAPPEAAAALAAAGIGVLTKKLANRWTLAGTAALVALGVAAVLVRRWRGGRSRPEADLFSASRP